MKTQTKRIKSLLPYVANVVNYRGKVESEIEQPIEDNLPKRSWLVGWQCGFEPMVIAVTPDAISCMADAEDAALDYLRGKNWFGSAGEREADFAIQIP